MANAASDNVNASDIAARIDKNGYAVVSNYVPSEKIAGAECFVRDAVSRNGGQYIGFNGSAELGGTFLQSMGQDASFIELCKAIYAAKTHREPPEAKFYQVLRCLAGDTARRHSMVFHYDSYVLTALFPIIIPQTGMRGDLLMIPNLRPLRSTYAMNLADKMLVDNPASQRLLKRMYERGSKKLTHVQMTPGNLYFFWGYMSLHTNEAIDPGSVRATALFHYANPHEASVANTALGRLRRRPSLPIKPAGADLVGS